MITTQAAHRHAYIIVVKHRIAYMCAFIHECGTNASLFISSFDLWSLEMDIILCSSNFKIISFPFFLQFFIFLNEIATNNADHSVQDICNVQKTVTTAHGISLYHIHICIIWPRYCIIEIWRQLHIKLCSTMSCYQKRQNLVV